MEHLIKVEDLCKIYNPGENEVRALDHINLEIDEGEFVAIIGQSGSGKSTFMNMLGCLDVPTSGKYYLNGTDVSTMTDNQLSEIRNREIGFIFQNYQLIPTYDILQNIIMPLVVRGMSSQEARERCMDTIRLLGIDHRLAHKPAELSGGQKQRASIARALVGNPALLLADEPTGALDSSSGKEVLKLFEKLNDMGNTIVMITHDLNVAKATGRIVHIIDGQLSED